MKNDEVKRVSRSLNYKNASLPFIYLGLPVGSSMRKTNSWDPVISKFQLKLAKWKAKSLSFGGRLTLIKAVMTNLPTYYFSLFKAPISVIKLLEQIRSKFFWQGGVEEKKISWVAWSKVAASVKSGGLGIGSLKALNFSLLSKWLWRWHTEKDALWNHILHSIHGAKGGDFLNYSSIGIKGTWYDILKTCHDVNSLNIPLSSFFTRSIGEGVSIKFWDEEWLGTFKLAEVYPRLYALESMKDCNIADRLLKLNGHLSLAWNWRRCIRGGREKEEMDSLTCLIQGVELKSGPDGWNWALESSGKFTVKSLRVKLDEKILGSSHEKTRWNPLVPKKVNILVWRADKDSLATRCNLDKRCIDLHSILCPMCEDDVETLDHLMGRCSWSRNIWNLIFKWCGFSLSGDLDYKSVCNFVNQLSTEKKRMFSPFHLQCFEAIIFTSIWHIWRSRNAKVFRLKESNGCDIFKDVQSLSFCWVSNRCKNFRLDWDLWVKNPVLAISPIM